MLTLYHTKGAVCAQKVRLALAEKHLEWRSVEIDFADLDFMAGYKRDLNPQGVVPTLVIDGTPLVESNVILQWIDDVYPAPALTPADALTRARMRIWLAQIDIDVHTAINALSFGMVYRARFLAMPPERREAVYAAIPDTERRRRRQELVEQGLDSPLVGAAVSRFVRLFRDMESALAQSDYLLGADYSLADLALTPYFERLTALGFDRVWGDYPKLDGWWWRMQARGNYAAAIAAWDAAAARVEVAPAVKSAWPRIADYLTA